jgi:hypothetical protein
MTSPASQLGTLSWKSRKKGKTKKQISAEMRALALRRHRPLDKSAIPTRN